MNTNEQSGSPSILIVDDDVAIMRCVGAFLEKHENLRIVDYAQHAQLAIALALSKKPDLVLMDIHMPGADAFWACREIIELSHGEIHVLFYTGFPRDQYLDKCLAAGASGMVIKHSEPIHNLALAIRHVLAGHSYYSPELAQRLVELESGKQVSRTATLTHREVEILRLIARGRTNHEISKKLDVSLRLVVKSISDTKKKLKIETTNELLIYAANEGLVYSELLFSSQHQEQETSRGC